MSGLFGGAAGGEEEPTLSWDIGVAEASSGGGGGGSAGAEAKPQGSLLQLEGSVDAAAVDLAERAHKQRLLDDLHELAAFLSQRIAEGEDQSTGFWREPGAVDSKVRTRNVSRQKIFSFPPSNPDWLTSPAAILAIHSTCDIT